MTDPRQAKAKRLADSAQGVLNQLDAGAELSAILPTARLFVEHAAYQVHVYWLDFEIYGIGNVPGQVTPLQTEPEKQAFALYWSLHSTQDLREITGDKAFKRFQKQEGGPPKKDWLVTQSISSLENSVREFVSPDQSFTSRYPDEALRLQVSHSERREILKNVRAYLHRHMGRVWRESTEENENFELFGPDYRFVIDNLHALNTEVGDELKAAAGLLRSDNPADWGAAALVCRNVVLKLGPILFAVEVDSHKSVMAGKSLDLRGEREKNRLLAYIDCHWVTAPNDVMQQSLSRCAELAIRLYERGSMGKRSLRFADAQQLVADAFELVALLASVTGLVSLTNDQYLTTPEESKLKRRKPTTK